MAIVLTNAITLLKQPHIAVSYGRWLASPMPTVALPWGDRLCGFRSFSEYRSAITGVPPASEIAFFRSALRQGGVAMDIGANLGAMALLMAHCGASVVHAFEPASGTADILEQTAKQYASIAVHRAAMSDHVGTAFFIDRPSASAMNKLADGGHAGNAVPVRTDTIDAFCAGHRIERIAFLKIDVEGFEPRVVRGAIRTLSERRVALGMIEIFPQLLEAARSSTRELSELLAGLGYSIRNIEKDGSIGEAPDLETIHPTATQNYALAPAQRV
jgi:FkbM family methyltransferase